jgi:hypothetical protein
MTKRTLPKFEEKICNNCRHLYPDEDCNYCCVIDECIESIGFSPATFYCQAFEKKKKKYIIATHEESDGAGYCRNCGTTIGEAHHADCKYIARK